MKSRNSNSANQIICCPSSMNPAKMQTLFMRNRSLLLLLFIGFACLLMFLQQNLMTDSVSHGNSSMHQKGSAVANNAGEDSDEDDGEEGNEAGKEVNDIESLPLYERIVSDGQQVVPNRRVVHLDLKGAPLLSKHYQALFRVIKRANGTGVLIEWEDMFPFTGKLSSIPRANAYTLDEVKQILQWAKDERLEVIPLVQTFGHLEYVLKHKEFKPFRQRSFIPNVLCIGSDEAVALIVDALDQVAAVHNSFGPAAPLQHFHIGGDEAWEYGVCEADRRAMESKFGGSKERLMLNHYAKLASHLKKKHNTRVLMWHDMLDNKNVTKYLDESKLSELVEPVVWNYAENVTKGLRNFTWPDFSQNVQSVWGASSFKGADGPSKLNVNNSHYVQNHLSWIEQMIEAKPLFKNFRGLILTGWQRFDHFAVLCEILPDAIPSIVTNLALIQNAKTVKERTAKLLNCQPSDIGLHWEGSSCSFFGKDLRTAIRALASVVDRIETEFAKDGRVIGWLTEYNIAHEFSETHFLEQLNQTYIYDIHLQLQAISKTIRPELSEYFHQSTVDEWMEQKLTPHLNRFARYANFVDKMITAA